ncbi:toll/interleukin-1 receptor domain-containing protein [Agrobacterium tumefaciens]|uniref:toll/interleukin-1 receptor domain-containing protein n=1 Tax=Agrobacterium tumefaciens TaxID=358 RepID=UPI00046FF312
MMAKAKSYTIFLSHAAADEKLVKEFEKYLSRALGIPSAEIFCSSLEGQGVTKGDGFVDSIREAANNSKAVVALISPAYLDSAFCMGELGAAWILQTHRLPLIVPPNTFKNMNATLLGITGVQIDNVTALKQGIEDLRSKLNIAAPTSGVLDRATEDWTNAWKKLKNKVPRGQRVEGAIHNEVVEHLKEAKAKVSALKESKTALEAKYNALLKTRTRAEVIALQNENSDTSWEKAFDDQLATIRNLYRRVGGREIAIHLIADSLGLPSYPDDDTPSDELSRAAKLGVWDAENRTWVYTKEVKQIGKCVESIRELLSENEHAADDLKSSGREDDPERRLFWEEHL